MMLLKEVTEFILVFLLEGQEIGSTKKHKGRECKYILCMLKVVSYKKQFITTVNHVRSAGVEIESCAPWRSGNMQISIQQNTHYILVSG